MIERILQESPSTCAADPWVLVALVAVILGGAALIAWATRGADE